MTLSRRRGNFGKERFFVVPDAQSQVEAVSPPSFEAPLDPNLKDVFCGADCVRKFSAQLAMGRAEDLGDEAVAAVLSPQAVPAFRFASHCLQGFVRKTTGEPAFCHSADIALRAKDLGYSERIVQVALLHDTIEDRSKKLSDVLEHVAELSTRFSTDIAQDVRCSTNVYSVIIRGLESRIPNNLPFDDAAPGKLRRTLAELHHELPSEIKAHFQHEYAQLLDHFLAGIDLSGGARKARIDKKYTVVSELRLQSYKLFVQDIHDDARFRALPRGSSFHEDALVVKALDLVDNLRTSEVANLGSLERILLKAETFLDCTFFLHDYIRERPHTRTSFIDLYDFLKYHLIEQLLERRRALVFLADTRFGFLADYLMREVSRLQEKYKVITSPIAQLNRLRESIQEQNLVNAG